MLRIGDAKVRNCQGFTRREMLQVAGLGVAGITLADWFRNQEAGAAPLLKSLPHRKSQSSRISNSWTGGKSPNDWCT